MNRVENQKLNQTAAAAFWLGFWFSIRPSTDTGTHYHYQEEEMKEAQCVHPPPPPSENDSVIGSNQCMCLLKGELKTKNSTKRQQRFTRK